MHLEKSQLEMTATRSAAPGTKRYAPWLQKALRIKEETNHFWNQQGARQSHAQEEPVNKKTDAKSSFGVRVRRTSNNTAQGAQSHHDGHANEKNYSSIWQSVAADDGAYVTQALETMEVSVFLRCETSTNNSPGGGVTLLHEAAFHGATRAVEAILRYLQTHTSAEARRVYVNCVDTVHSQTTPLIAACRSTEGDMKSRLEIAKLLVHAGADVERQDSHGDNVIHWCARTSNNVILRWLLKTTDAGVNAVFAQNFKRESPLDIAKRELARVKTSCFSAQNVFNSLRSVDRKCNMRLKMQILKRQSTNIQNERTAALDAEWANAVATADDDIEQAEGFWNESLDHAETNRMGAEVACCNAASAAARAKAIQWLDTKDGKNYVKKQQAIATDELKVEILRGKITKPKDMKKAATQRASETYIHSQEEIAGKAALDEFLSKRPSYPTDPNKLKAMLK